MVVGLVGIGGQHDASVFTSGDWIHPNKITTKVSPFSFSALIMLLPAALFAFDGFIHFTNIATDIVTDIKNPKKNVPLGIIIGMGRGINIVFFNYIAQLVPGQSMPENLISGITNNINAKSIISRTLNVFIAIAALGVCNGFIMSQIRSTEAAMEDNLLLGSKFFKTKTPKIYGFYIYFNDLFFSVMLIGIPAIVMNTDSIIDCITNFPVLYFFILYTGLIIAQIFNRKK